jgi:hypothetical protein
MLLPQTTKPQGKLQRRQKYHLRSIIETAKLKLDLKGRKEFE